MRKILFSAILCMVSVAAFAQKVSGRVVDEKGKPLQNVSLQVIGRDSIACTSDDKGLFVLDCGNEKKAAILRISCVGYQALDVTLDGEATNMQLGTLKLMKESYKLCAATDKVIGVEAVNLVTGAEETYRGPVILATGHSARDVYRYLASAKIDIEAKGIAVGVRLEHPSRLIDQIQYHNKNGRGKYLPAAEYSFVTQVDGRGVYSFCMCPGGFVIPAATGPGQLVVNGMSPSNRGTAWSNSGMVVETHPKDVEAFVNDHRDTLEEMELKKQEDSSCFTLHSSLNMMYFQQILERLCWQQGNMKQTAPSQRMADFVNNRLSYDLPKSSYAPGLLSSPLHFWMPGFVSKRLQEGFKTFGKNAHGFLTNEAILIATETRTSSPVRIVRDHETLQHVRIQGLFPCGEGAGYAGGIVSAGVDGERCAEMCAEYLKSCC